MSEEFCIGRKHWYLCVKKHCSKNCPIEKQQSNDETRRVIHLFRGILHDGENMDIWQHASSSCGRSQKQQPKLFFSDRQYVQLICVGRPAIMEAFCRAQKKTSRDSYSSFSLRTLATVQKECSLHCKSVFLRYFSWSWRQSVSWGGILQGTQEH